MSLKSGGLEFRGFTWRLGLRLGFRVYMDLGVDEDSWVGTG